MAMSAAKVLARRYGLDEGMVTLATAMTGKQAAQFLGVSRDVGDAIAGSDALDIKVTFDAGASGYADGFDVSWTRADKPKLRTNTIAAGATTTITPIPTGTSCEIVSVVPEEDAPTDWHWGETTYDPADGEVKIAEGTNAKITVTPTIVMDTGSVEISSVLVDEDESGFEGPFTVTYTVDSGTPITVQVPVNDSVVIEDLPGGATVDVTAVTPANVDWFAWEAPVLDPVDGEVTVVSNSVGTCEATYTIVEAGSVEISTVLVDDDNSGVECPIAVTYTVDSGTPVTVEIPPNDSVVVENIPVGATFVVTATNPLPVDTPAGYEWVAVVLDPVDGDVTIVGSDVATCEVTYEIELSTP